MEQAQLQFDTNFWGAVRMTKAILPVMRKQQNGKIITIGSLAGLIGVPFQSYYAASKHSLEGFFKSLRFEVRSFNIKVSIIEPGFFKTNLHQSFVYAEPKLRQYDTIRNNALQVLEESIENADLPVPVAKTVLKIIKLKNPGYSYRVGQDARILPVLQFVFYRLFELGTIKKFNLINRTTANG
jgi:NAD(P)-dependent dehydrogenase (short-subunit alcohol dehydrogenase family)